MALRELNISALHAMLQIEGKYPIKPQLPAVAGNEGVGIVRRVGSQAS